MRKFTSLLGLILTFTLASLPALSSAAEDSQCPQGIYFSMEEGEVPIVLDTYLLRPLAAIASIHVVLFWYVGAPVSALLSEEPPAKWDENLLLPVRSTFTVPLGIDCTMVRK